MPSGEFTGAQTFRDCFRRVGACPIYGTQQCRAVPPSHAAIVQQSDLACPKLACPTSKCSRASNLGFTVDYKPTETKAGPLRCIFHLLSNVDQKESYEAHILIIFSSFGSTLSWAFSLKMLGSLSFGALGPTHTNMSHNMTTSCKDCICFWFLVSLHLTMAAYAQWSWGRQVNRTVVCQLIAGSLDIPQTGCLTPALIMKCCFHLLC
jgi:hypothetical protein|mmetsp:Transcript_70497/g.117777  ORF Transcript_70497/g.117777 Transcript_70497/m.117777 type:complete len:207 (+) Transcript_70497:77-697(+)